MKRVFVESHNVLSPLGDSTSENFMQLKKGISGVKLQERTEIDSIPICVSLVTDNQLNSFSPKDLVSQQYSRFERLLICSVHKALSQSSVDLKSNKTIFIFSTTKGSVSLLEEEDFSPALKDRMTLHYSAKKVSTYFKNQHTPVVISNACISGALALLHAKRLLENGIYENAIVVGADTISRFVFSGFKSFQALSVGRCKPFSEGRDGINLGEASSTIILSTQMKNGVFLSGGAVSNDSNHISGPSRTGEELSYAINKALKDAHISSREVDFVSAHGTATLYNDEMEAKALNLSGLQNVPVNSLKGYYGHTLGAAGLLESAISLQSIKENLIIPTAGFTTLGVSVPVNVCKENIVKEINHFVKTASGFGGCNIALVFSKS